MNNVYPAVLLPLVPLLSFILLNKDQFIRNGKTLLILYIMPEVKKTYYNPKDINVKISEIHDGIYRISGFIDTYGITYNQFLSK